MAFVDAYTEPLSHVIEHLKHEIATLRTGRATPALVEDIHVDSYGSMQPLKAVASISVADAKTINVEPWDKSLLQAVETAIAQSDLGINPVNDGKLLRLPLPDLTSERRQELIKVLHRKLEESRIAIRKVREDMRDDIDAQYKAKSISEDEKFTYQDAVEKKIKEYNEEIKQIGADKEKEIQTV